MPAYRDRTEERFEKVALPDGAGVWLRALSAEEIAQRAIARMTESELAEITLPTRLAERLMRRLGVGSERVRDLSALEAASAVAEDTREELRVAMERDFARAVREREAQGVAPDWHEMPRIWEAVTSRDEEFLRAQERLRVAQGVRDLWYRLAPSLQARLLDVPSFRRLVFGEDEEPRREDGAPYKHARMLLTDLILVFGAVVRTEGREASDIGADITAHAVELFYPTLNARMSEPQRLEWIRVAIVSAAASMKKKPWNQIIRAWRGIEPGEHFARWRQDYDEYKKGAPKRT